MSSIESTSANQPSKRGLNPIIKAMNDYRNNVIGEKIGTKAPKKTAPVFRVTLEAARLELGIEEGVKNTIAIVDKASELFTANPEKFLELAEKLESQLKDKDTGKTKAKKTKDSKGKTKKADKEGSEDVETNEKTKNTKSKSSKKLSKKDTEENSSEVVKETKQKKSSKKLVEDNNSEEEVNQVKKKSPKKPVQKKALLKKQVVESDSNSESDSDSD
tara:strand:+ start:2527 stop:3177 length:651 start_codon:yes stop_codon:yes gene_type:complete